MAERSVAMAATAAAATAAVLVAALVAALASAAAHSQNSRCRGGTCRARRQARRLHSRHWRPARIRRRRAARREAGVQVEEVCRWEARAALRHPHRPHCLHRHLRLHYPCRPHYPLHPRVAVAVLEVQLAATGPPAVAAATAERGAEGSAARESRAAKPVAGALVPAARTGMSGYNLPRWGSNCPPHAPSRRIPRRQSPPHTCCTLRCTTPSKKQRWRPHSAVSRATRCWP